MEEDIRLELFTVQQVRDWLKEENPKYPTPLSQRQFECADNRPAWKRRYY